jgi:hypothetical protein
MRSWSSLATRATRFWMAVTLTCSRKQGNMARVKDGERSNWQLYQHTLFDWPNFNFTNQCLFNQGTPPLAIFRSSSYTKSSTMFLWPKVANRLHHRKLQDPFLWPFWNQINMSIMEYVSTIFSKARTTGDLSCLHMNWVGTPWFHRLQALKTPEAKIGSKSTMLPHGLGCT